MAEFRSEGFTPSDHYDSGIYNPNAVYEKDDTSMQYVMIALDELLVSSTCPARMSEGSEAMSNGDSFSWKRDLGASYYEGIGQVPTKQTLSIEYNKSKSEAEDERYDVISMNLVGIDGVWQYAASTRYILDVQGRVGVLRNAVVEYDDVVHGVRCARSMTPYDAGILADELEGWQRDIFLENQWPHCVRSLNELP